MYFGKNIRNARFVIKIKTQAGQMQSTQHSLAISIYKIIATVITVIQNNIIVNGSQIKFRKTINGICHSLSFSAYIQTRLLTLFFSNQTLQKEERKLQVAECALNCYFWYSGGSCFKGFFDLFGASDAIENAWPIMMHLKYKIELVVTKTCEHALNKVYESASMKFNW